jgi:hypothetical protein
MIKIIRAEHIRQKILRLYFSDNSWGDYDLRPLIERQTELTLPLNDDSYFQQFFLELGALCWRNGLELSPRSIHRKLEERQQLNFGTKVA